MMVILPTGWAIESNDQSKCDDLRPGLMSQCVGLPRFGLAPAGGGGRGAAGLVEPAAAVETR